MKYTSLILLFVLFSCGEKETILLPKSDSTIIKEVQDYSPIYLFFKTKGKDTLVEVNRKNSISSTNWIFHIDKRLPLRLVVPEIIKLQDKKEGSAHKSESSENYFSYSDSLHKNLAFIPFTKLKFLQGKSHKEVMLISKNDFQLTRLKKDSGTITLGFDQNLSFGTYLQYKIAIHNLHLSTISKEEFMY